MLNRWYQFLWLFIISFSISAQTSIRFSWRELANMPKAITNNAIVAAKAQGENYVYSFGGIDSSLQYSGIVLDVFRYDIVNDKWLVLPNLPDSLGKIASAASVVNNIIYVIGGYHVLPNGSEISSDKVHRFNPETNSYLSDGSRIPIAIDDQVQVVWRDSLIYVITGWSNNNNVNAVQIYNPVLDDWTRGTPVPNNNSYKAFGASGAIIGDTIFYMGGAQAGFNFPLGQVLRIGIINPHQPDSITWSFVNNALARGYRMGAVAIKHEVLWLGGATTSYNFDALAYNGSGVVSPKSRIVILNTQNDSLFEEQNAILPVMDLRGVAKISNHQFVIAGGILNNQIVSDKTIFITDNLFTSIANIEKNSFQVHPNPASEFLIINFSKVEKGGVSIFNQEGLELMKFNVNGEIALKVDIHQLNSGLYFVVVKTKDEILSKKITVLK